MSGVDDDLWFVAPSEEGSDPTDGESAFEWTAVGRRSGRATLTDLDWINAITELAVAALRDPEGTPLRAEAARRHADVCRELCGSVIDMDRPDREALIEMHTALSDLAMLAAAVDGLDPAESVASSAAPALAVAVDKTGEVLRHRITPRKDGRFRVRWSADERVLVRTSIDRLDQVIDAGHPALTRLFPGAYPDDPERNAGYAALAHGELIDSRREAFATVRYALDRPVASAEELHALLRALNDVRLVLGTQLEVSEDDTWITTVDREDEPDARTYMLLTALLGDVIWALQRAV